MLDIRRRGPTVWLMGPEEVLTVWFPIFWKHSVFESIVSNFLETYGIL